MRSSNQSNSSPSLIILAIFAILVFVSATASGDEPSFNNKHAETLKLKKVEVPTWTDAVKAAKEFPGFKFLGEYTQRDTAIQVVPAEGRFYVSTYQGGFPGGKWDGGRIKHEWVEEDEIADRLLGCEKVDRSTNLDFTAPPADAIRLFEGTTMEHWRYGKMIEGVLQAGAVTKQTFRDFKLHFECKTPFKPSLPLSHPGRGNSGVFALGTYEIQVMDTFGLDLDKAAWNETKIIKKPDTWCGSIYGIRPPTVNVCLPPLAWQTFDVEFTAAQFEGETKVRDAVMTIHQNGVLVQDKVKLPSGTGGGPKGPRPEVAQGPILVQKHGNPVMYRNIWIIKH